MEMRGGGGVLMKVDGDVTVLIRACLRVSTSIR